MRRGQWASDMAASKVTLSLASGIAGAVLGASVAVAVVDARAPAARGTLGRGQASLQPAPEVTDPAGAFSVPSGQGATGSKRNGDVRDPVSGAEPVGQIQGLRSDMDRKEVAALRGRVAAAQREAEAARIRIAELEGGGREAKPPPHHKYDLGPEDWRALGAEKIVKYRLPCSQYREIPAGTLQELGIAPDEQEVLRRAYANSADRQKGGLLPLCAAALDGRLDLAAAVGIDACRHIIVSTAPTRGEDEGETAKRIAAFMAGDAPLPDEAQRTVLDKTFLLLVQEAGLFEGELAEAFGPEDAHRLVFSDRLCFSSATFQLGGEKRP
jgi:hypothetical protein